MTYDYKKHFKESAIVYVDKHKNEPGWIDKMIAYYTAPEHPCRRHEYTEYVLEYLYQSRSSL